MKYQLKLFKQPRKQLRNLPNQIQDDSIRIILDLQFEPLPAFAEQLRPPLEKIHKIKIDGWRLFYRVDEVKKTVTIISLKRRESSTYGSIYTLLL